MSEKMMSSQNDAYASGLNKQQILDNLQISSLISGAI